MHRDFICIVCPNSCEMQLDGENISGAKCKRGEDFVLQEAVSPKRVITTSFKYDNKVIPVKSKEPLPLKQNIEIVNALKSIKVDCLPDIGDEVVVDFKDQKLIFLITARIS